MAEAHRSLRQRMMNRFRYRRVSAIGLENKRQDPSPATCVRFQRPRDAILIEKSPTR